MQISRVCGPVLAIALAACQSRHAGGGNQPATDGSVARTDAGVEAVFDLPSVVQGVVRVPAHRRVRVLRDVVIGVGGRLELQPGDTVAVANGKGLYVKGGELFARGTPEDRIVFTSWSANPQPGDWCGIVFDWADPPRHSWQEPWPASGLEHVVIEFAGRPWTGVGVDQRAGGLSIQGYLGDGQHDSPAGKLVLSNVEFRNNALRGLDVRTDAPLSWKDLKFGPNSGVSARIDIDGVEHLGMSPTESVELVGDVRGTAQLPQMAAPYVVVESLSVGSHRKDGPALLTIAPGTTLKFKSEQGLSVGGYFPGRLVAHGVTFTSAEAVPKAGDWGGIHFSENSSADLEDDTFEYAGCCPRYVMTWSTSAAPHIDLRRSTFRNNAGPAFHDPISCTKWNKDPRGNVSEGQPLCTREK